MPDVSKEYARLRRFVGRWVGDDVLHSQLGAGARDRAETILTARSALDGRVVLVDTMRARAGREQITHAVFGYDPHAGHFTLHRFRGAAAENAAPLPDGAPARGSWDGDTVTFIEEAPVGQLRHQYAFRGWDHIGYALSVWAPHGWLRRLEGTYHRDTPAHPAKYGRQADAIARTYIAHGATPAEAEHEAWAVVMKLHRRHRDPAAGEETR